jgi:hypothetical protein
MLGYRGQVVVVLTPSLFHVAQVYDLSEGSVNSSRSY